MQTNSNQGSKRFSLKKDLYKTELCANWMKTGFCRYGSKCQFAHGMNDIKIIVKNEKYKTRVCTQYKKTGYCKYGNRCLFVHDPSEKKLFYEISKKVHFHSKSFAHNHNSHFSAFGAEPATEPTVRTTVEQKNLVTTFLKDIDLSSSPGTPNSFSSQKNVAGSLTYFDEFMNLGLSRTSSFPDLDEEDVYSEEKKFCLRNNVYSSMLGFEFEMLGKEGTESETSRSF